MTQHPGHPLTAHRAELEVVLEKAMLVPRTHLFSFSQQRIPVYTYWSHGLYVIARSLR